MTYFLQPCVQHDYYEFAKVLLYLGADPLVLDVHKDASRESLQRRVQIMKFIEDINIFAWFT